MLNKLVVLGVLSVIAVPALAGTPVLDRRENRQQVRIAGGIESGALTAREAVRLERGEVRLTRHEARAKSDGVVTMRERAHLQSEANHMSRRIYRQKHDGQTRN